MARHTQLRHGHRLHDNTSPTYRSWKSMHERCRRLSDSRYGGRGIKVCKRWSSFEAFLADMGKRPIGKTLDRVDNADGYSAENCRWATPTEQANNRRQRRDAKIIEAYGQDFTAGEWSRMTGLPWSTINSRLHRGWSTERALLPVRTKAW